MESAIANSPDDDGPGNKKAKLMSKIELFMSLMMQAFTVEAGSTVNRTVYFKGNVELTDVRPSDSGVYCCSVLSRQGNKTENITTGVFTLQVTTDWPTVIAMDQESMKLDCHSHMLGQLFESSTRHWIHNGTYVTSPPSRLAYNKTDDVVDKMNKSMKGVWECEVIHSSSDRAWKTAWYLVSLDDAPSGAARWYRTMAGHLSIVILILVIVIVIVCFFFLYSAFKERKNEDTAEESFGLERNGWKKVLSQQMEKEKVNADDVGDVALKDQSDEDTENDETNSEDESSDEDETDDSVDEGMNGNNDKNNSTLGKYYQGVLHGGKDYDFSGNNMIYKDMYDDRCGENSVGGRYYDGAPRNQAKNINEMLGTFDRETIDQKQDLNNWGLNNRPSNLPTSTNQTLPVSSRLTPEEAFRWVMKNSKSDAKNNLVFGQAYFKHKRRHTNRNSMLLLHTPKLQCGEKTDASFHYNNPSTSHTENLRYVMKTPYFDIATRSNPRIHDRNSSPSDDRVYHPGQPWIYDELEEASYDTNDHRKIRRTRVDNKRKFEMAHDNHNHNLSQRFSRIGNHSGEHRADDSRVWRWIRGDVKGDIGTKQQRVRSNHHYHRLSQMES